MWTVVQKALLAEFKALACKCKRGRKAGVEVLCAIPTLRTQAGWLGA